MTKPRWAVTGFFPVAASAGHSNAMKLPLPKEYVPPDTARPGEPFEAVATIVPGEDGSFNLTAIDGNELAEAETEEEGMDEMPEFEMPYEDPAMLSNI